MCIIGQVPSVKIIAKTATTVTFTADSRLVDANNDSPVGDKRVAGTYTVNVQDEIWETDASQTRDGIPIPSHVKLEIGATGPIYLKCCALVREGTSAGGPCVIRGSGGPVKYDSMFTHMLSDELSIPLKWPDCGGLGDYEDYKINPAGIQVVCVSLGDTPQRVKIDLFDPAIAAPTQNLQLEGHRITVALTKAGCDMLGVPFKSNPTKVEILPLIVNLTGKPASGQGHPGTIDLRNQVEASPVQGLDWMQAGGVITVRMSTLGASSRFGLYSPDLVKALDQLRNNPELLEAARTLGYGGISLDRLAAPGLANDASENRGAKELLDRLRS